MFQAHIGLIRKLRISATLAGIFLFLLSVFAVFPVPSSADTHATGGQSNSLSLTVGDIGLNLNVESPNGTFNSTSSNIEVSTGNPTGYTLGIKLKDGATSRLVNGTDYLESISEATTESSFRNTSALNGFWGYRPSMIDSEANTDFLAAPSSEGDILDVTEEASTTTYTIGLGARANYGKETGKYSSTFVIESVANPTTEHPHQVDYVIDNNTNSVEYNCRRIDDDLTRYSHTANIADDGTVNGDYASNTNTTEVITIPNATRLHVVMSYGGENSVYDWVSVWTGNHPNYTAYDNYNIGETFGTENKRFGGSFNTIEGYIEGDSVTFGFRSDNGSNGYGYYAVITPVSDTDTLCEPVAVSGTYITPSKAHADFLGWSTTSGAVTPEFVTELDVTTKAIDVEASATTTLYAVWRNWQVYTVNYVDGASTNTVEYNCLPKVTKYSHTANIADDGTRSGDYAVSLNTNEVITIPHAKKLHITMTYGGEGEKYDWVSVFEGNHPEYTADDYANGVRFFNLDTNTYDDNGKYGGAQYTVEGEIDGDTVTFAFKSDGGSNGYGYYAVITPVTNTNTYCNHVPDGNQYVAPEKSGHILFGWNTDSTATTAEFHDEDEVIDNIELGNSNTKTLYSIFNTLRPLTVNYKNGANTNSVEYSCYKTGASGTVYSHTPNIADDGTKQGNYANNLDLKEYKTLKDASKLHISLTYGGEGASYDYAVIWEGYHPEYETRRNYTMGVRLGTNSTGKYGGGSNEHVEGDVYTDTLTIGYVSDSGGVGSGYGYYAVISVASDTVCLANPTSGSYSDLSDENDVFLGWNTDPNAATPLFTNEAEVRRDLNLDDGSTLDLYAIWGKPTYVSFNNNGGTGQMETVQITYGTSTNLPQNTFTKQDAVFTRWNTASDHTGTYYNNKASVTASNPQGENITLYAIWGEQTIINYDANGGAGTMQPTVITYNQSSYLAANTFTKQNAVFVRWNTKADGTGTSYASNYSYSASNVDGVNITLYAIWGEPTIFTFDSNGGTGSMSSQMITYNTTDTLSQNTFTKQNAVFVGWNTESDNTGTSYADEQSFTASTLAGENITLYAIWGEQTKFNFNANGGTGSMSQQVYDYNTTDTLSTNTFTNTGKTFLAWNTAADGSGISYIDEQSFTATKLAGETIDLYAIWITDNLPLHDAVNRATSGESHTGMTFEIAYEVAYAVAGKDMYEQVSAGSDEYAEVQNGNYQSLDVRFAMKDMTPEICASVTETYDDYRALDTRDNKIYHITKLADGKCWMTQNLDLDLSDDPTKALTSDDTDLNSKSTWTPDRSTITFTGTSPTGWADEYYYQYSADSGDVYVASSGSNSDDTVYTSLVDCQAGSHTQEECEHYHVGNYYNWTAAIAENNSNTSALKQTYNNAPDSICPAGWRLPRGVLDNSGSKESAAETNTLLVAHNITSNWAAVDTNIGFNTNGFINLRSSPLYIVRAGMVQGGSLATRANTADYWTSTVYNDSNALELRILNDRLSPAYYYRRYMGRSIRCVAR